MALPGKKFSYYRNLSRAQQRIYDRSDAIETISLSHAERYPRVIKDLRSSLERDSLSETKQAVERLVRGLCQDFRLPQLAVKVLARRPSGSWGEMHGLYEPEGKEMDVLTVWMRTAKRKQPVAFRTFLRTVVHEFIHHLDFAHFKLPDSFHTEGFFKRESSLLKQLLGEEKQSAGGS